MNVFIDCKVAHPKLRDAMVVVVVFADVGFTDVYRRATDLMEMVQAFSKFQSICSRPVYKMLVFWFGHANIFYMYFNFYIIIITDKSFFSMLLRTDKCAKVSKFVNLKTQALKLVSTDWL